MLMQPQSVTARKRAVDPGIRLLKFRCDVENAEVPHKVLLYVFLKTLTSGNWLRHFGPVLPLPLIKPCWFYYKAFENWLSTKEPQSPGAAT